MDNENAPKKTTDELVAEYLAKQITESDQDNRLIKKMSAATALIAAFATLVGALLSWNSANNANKSAEDIKSLLNAFNTSQTHSQDRRELLNENQALLNLFDNNDFQTKCIQIPLTEADMWGAYKTCVTRETGDSDISLGGPEISVGIRNACGREVGACFDKN